MLEENPILGYRVTLVFNHRAVGETRLNCICTCTSSVTVGKGCIGCEVCNIRPVVPAFGLPLHGYTTIAEILHIHLSHPYDNFLVLVKIIDWRTDSIFAGQNDVLAANENENGISLERLRYPELSSESIGQFNGYKCACLTKLQDLYFISIDNRLYASRDLVEWKIALSLQPDNFIWHMCMMQSWLIAQEYGKPPTYLYRSQNGIEWERIISNKQVDSTSRHWHSIANDNGLNCLYATLGDSNVTKVIKLEDNFSWKALYIGPWQFVPIVVSKDKAVFGMDSSLVPGGIGIYRHDVGWDFRFLKWNDGNIKLGQICDLKLLSNGSWVAALGSPTAILVSKDLERWVLAEFDGTSSDFNHFMNIGEGNDYVAISTGKKLLIFRKNDLYGLTDKEPFVTPYPAYKERLVGHLQISKRRILKLAAT